MSSELRETFDRTVRLGDERLTRTWANLLATGIVGGFDVGLGVLGLLVVRTATGSIPLSALAFGIGFIALALAGSELFTENFLVPIAAVVAHRGTMGQVLRLWLGTLLMNLAGGWIMMALVILAVPSLHATALAVGSVYPKEGITAASLGSAVLGGTVITLMTWMQRNADSVVAQVVSAVATAFLLAATPLSHAIVFSLEMFAALQVGAPFGYLVWLELLGWFTLGNMLGGLGLVTLLRFLQVGSKVVHEEQEQAEREQQGQR